MRHRLRALLGNRVDTLNLGGVLDSLAWANAQDQLKYRDISRHLRPSTA